MKFPKIPFETEIIGKTFPEGTYSISDENREVLGIFQRNLNNLELKSYGLLVDISEKKASRYHGINPLAKVDFQINSDQVALLHMGSKYNGSRDIQTAFFDLNNFPIFQSFCSSSDVLENGEYLYFEIINLYSRISSGEHEAKELMLNLANKTLFIKLLPKEDWIEFSPNCYVDSIGAIEIKGEDCTNLRKEVDKIMKILSIYFMNYISAGNFKWWESSKKRWLEFNGVRSYESVTPIEMHVCMNKSRAGDLSFVYPSNIDKNKRQLIEKFLKVFSNLNIEDLDFFREFIAGGMNELYIENKIVKLMTVAEKIHAMLGINMGIMQENRSVTKEIVESIYQSYNLNNFEQLQSVAYNERGKILHSRFLNTTDEAVEKRFEIADKIPELIGFLLYALLNDMENDI